MDPLRKAARAHLQTSEFREISMAVDVNRVNGLIGKS
jgi:hypothetical protein